MPAGAAIRKLCSRRASAVTAANRLLSVLPARDRSRILAGCDEIELAFSEVLHEAGTPQRHVYFPTTGSISLVTPLDACAGLEVVLVGSEGMVGTSVLLGAALSPLHHLVHGSGIALRMSAASFRSELDRDPALRRRLNRYAYVKMQQIAQIAACVRFHVVEARLARWLLMTQDRSHSQHFRATHEILAYMLGVRRVGVTKAAASLQRQSLIRYRRGEITILDRQGLEARSCGCYVAANELYDRILGPGGRQH